MKNFLIVILTILAIHSQGQQVCKDTVYKVNDTSVITDYDTIPVMHVTSWVEVIPHLSINTWYDTTWGLLNPKRREQLGKPPKMVVKSITEHKDSSYTYEHLTHYDTTWTQRIDSTVYAVIETRDSIGKKCTTIPVITKFGAKVQDGTSAEQIAVLNALGAKVARPTAIGLKEYTGKVNRLVDFYNAGIYNIVNINWSNTNQLIPFVSGSDTVLYKSQLERVLKDHAQKIGIACIENEPTNDGYYSGPMTDYINQLKISIPIFKKYGVKVADGCLHIEAIVTIMAGDTIPGRTKDNVIQQLQLLNAYASLPLDYVNIHTVVKGDSYPAGQIKKACDFIRKRTGKEVISNEWHLESVTATNLKNVVNQWREAAVPYSIIWSGGGQSPADAINSGASLTTMGGVYRDAISTKP